MNQINTIFVNLLDSLLDKLLYIPIFEMGCYRQNAGTKFTLIGDQLTRRLFKLVLMPDSKYAPIWKAEINTMLNDAKITLKPIKPTKSISEYCYEWLVEGYGMEIMTKHTQRSLNSGLELELLEPTKSISEKLTEFTQSSRFSIEDIYTAYIEYQYGCKFYNTQITDEVQTKVHDILKRICIDLGNDSFNTIDDYL